MSEKVTSPTVWAMLGLVVAILGWLLAQSGFPPVSGEPAFEISDSVRQTLRFAGAFVICVGLTVAALGRLRFPLGVFAAGVTLNIAAEAGIVTPHHLGIVGISAALLGSLWASRQVREGLRE
ncbi:MAG: hypothetical protein AAFQ82_05520 [Myxococcota bacterium]